MWEAGINNAVKLVLLGSQSAATPATYTISGVVYDADGTTAVASATVALGALTATSAANGTYTIADVPAGTSGSMTCTKAGYSWTAISVAAVAGNLTSQNYTGIRYILTDQFTTNESAPIVTPRTCEPGAGTLAVRDVETKISIATNALVMGQQATPALNEEDVVSGSATARSCGLAIYAQIAITTAGGYYGFANSATPAYDANLVDSIRFVNATTIRLHQDSTQANCMGDLVISLPNTYELVVVVRTNGTWAFVRGGAYSTWKLWSFSHISTGTNLRAALSSVGALTADNLKVAQLPTPFITQTGLATEGYAGSVSTGQAFTHEADFLATWTMTLPASGSNTIDFRKQDANNYWRVDVSSTGAATLYEVVAGSPTSRGTASGINTLPCYLKAFGSTIYFGYNTSAPKITYASATNFQTATAGLVTLGASGAVNNLYIYPYTLSGTAKAILDVLNP